MTISKFFVSDEHEKFTAEIEETFEENTARLEHDIIRRNKIMEQKDDNFSERFTMRIEKIENFEAVKKEIEEKFEEEFQILL